jgi:hypothetical protein
MQHVIRRWIIQKQRTPRKHHSQLYHTMVRETTRCQPSVGCSLTNHHQRRSLSPPQAVPARAHLGHARELARRCRGEAQLPRGCLAVAEPLLLLRHARGLRLELLELEALQRWRALFSRDFTTSRGKFPANHTWGRTKNKHPEKIGPHRRLPDVSQLGAAAVQQHRIAPHHSHVVTLQRRAQPHAAHARRLVGRQHQRGVARRHLEHEPEVLAKQHRDGVGRAAEPADVDVEAATACVPTPLVS